MTLLAPLDDRIVKQNNTVFSNLFADEGTITTGNVVLGSAFPNVSVPYTAYRSDKLVVIHVGYVEATTVASSQLYIQSAIGAIPALYRPDAPVLNPLSAGITAIVPANYGVIQTTFEVNLFANGQLEFNRIPLDFFAPSTLIQIQSFSLTFLSQ